MTVDIESGSVVRLIDGGLKMTVEKIIPTGGTTEVECVWFDEESELHREQFSIDAIEIVNE